ncbi:GNAT family N-acetyltransferase [Notoacmeibacter ruber]|uniref:GNAT family N-acetyltransferase n=1 Tax=Notoacmeibacter ruber TaxID=2670375 RepID=A0A3L7JEN5_9HYPH|nr:GNAT family N-acetyltransferase [Notoacmeibacter ruber]RLQ88031.1 GNAT family N-acetyltransferase [Notoacmeibacter ruber]
MSELKAVFTWLQRTEPPGPMPPAPLAGQMALMRVSNVPLAFYRFLLDQIGRNHHWVQRMRLPDDTLRSILDASTTDIAVLYLDGAPAGLFEIDRKRDGVAHIVHFGLMAHAQGRKLSRWFFHAALSAAWNEGTERVTIGTTSLDHPAALRLYQRFGFEVTERSQGTIRPLSEPERFQKLGGLS